MGPLVVAVFVLVEITSTTLGSYGYFIDELYYLACARHLAWGYVDHPPLSIGVLALASALLGTSKLAIRLPAIAAAAGSVAVSAVLAKRFGGGRFAQVLAAVCAASSPIALILGSFHSMNAIELLLWPLTVLALVHAAEGDRRGWLVAGAFFGLGLENKHTMVTLAVALAIGIAFTPMRAQLRTRWPWFGVAIAAALIVPNFLWQRAHGYESLEFYRNAQAMKNIPTPVLFAAGAGVIERWSQRGSVRAAACAIPALLGAALAPIGTPLLAPERAAAYAKTLGVFPQVERGKTSPLPQPLADRTGWPELARDVSEVVSTLSPDERRAALIVCSSYGTAGAIELLVENAPPVIATQNSYWEWGSLFLRERPEPKVVIAVSVDSAVLATLFEERTTMKVHRCDYCMSWRDEMPIVIARRPKSSLSAAWAGMKHFE